MSDDLVIHRDFPGVHIHGDKGCFCNPLVITEDDLEFHTESSIEDLLDRTLRVKH